jgi:hypothetical protein
MGAVVLPLGERRRGVTVLGSIGIGEFAISPVLQVRAYDFHLLPARVAVRFWEDLRDRHGGHMNYLLLALGLEFMSWPQRL